MTRDAELCDSCTNKSAVAATSVASKREKFRIGYLSSKKNSESDTSLRRI